MHDYLSWGRFPRLEANKIAPVFWRSTLPDLSSFGRKVLPYAQGRSYGDSCLNEKGVLLDVSRLGRFIEFDREAGVLRCECGVTLGEILRLIVPAGWFLPVVPGTENVSVGGAIANDIHGKNHHAAGSFGCFVLRLKLHRSDGEEYVCSLSRNSDLFAATIGGLGLTGVVVWAELRLKRVKGPTVGATNIAFKGLQEFFELSNRHDDDFEYSVAWLDCTRGPAGLKGVLTLANHGSEQRLSSAGSRRKARVIFEAPDFLLSRPLLKVFNRFYFHSQARRKHSLVPYDRFFFPLDVLADWNRLYGRRGLVQYQCVVTEDEEAATEAILDRVQASKDTPFLVVLKKFGDIRSPGLLSFPRPGTTLALDFPMQGDSTLALLDDLDAIVERSRGAVYPAKDARMSASRFRSFFPRWREFGASVDPNFSSSFWRRVNCPDH